MPLQLSGSLNVSGSVTAENITLTSGATIAGTASWAEYVVNGGGGVFPYTGSAEITGSLRVTGSISILDGSLLGTASFVSGSVFTSANRALSASHAITASYVSAGVGTTGNTLYSINPLAGGSINTNYSVILGYNAGESSSVAGNSGRLVLIGEDAGRYGINTDQSVFLGWKAGYSASNAYWSQHIGYLAGNTAHSAWESNMIGTGAGNGAAYAQRSNFLGKSAGAGAGSASYSNFIGQEAGSSATNAFYSSFMGYRAGYNAFSASYCIFIGNAAGGRSLTYGVGSYNIIIGTNITLPELYTNGINIGGLIFGSGSYGNLAGDPYSGSANGKIGINQPSPQYSLDVSGSIGLSDVLVLATVDPLPAIAPTGSIMVSGSDADNKPYYWNGATWTALF